MADGGMKASVEWMKAILSLHIPVKKITQVIKLRLLLLSTTDVIVITESWRAALLCVAYRTL
jgi:hypothetical protein